MSQILQDKNTVRMALAVLTYVTTGAMTVLFVGVAAADGLGLIDVLLGGLFAVLMVSIAMSFWTATFGFIDAAFRAGRQELRNAGETSSCSGLPATAILMPVYNESPTDVFASVEAMRRSLEELGHAESFDIFVLSDSTDPDVWIQEELAWAKTTLNDSGVRVYYRHRRENKERKAGNISDFCCRWGHAYEFMIVLDADSVMTGETLVEMTRRMQHDDDLGILQVPPRPVGCDSLFARLQQFSAVTYSQPFLRGFALWAGDDGNYWGHNAIIRTAAFTEHCGLPKLPGREPLGGEILSHDFVEAALMRRAGYKVCLADDLEGSFEQCPTGLEEYAQRDRRWCQGNLQHSRLLSGHDFATPSRLHLLMGVMSYAASPLWLLFMLGGVIAAIGTNSGPNNATVAIGLFAASMVMLLLPKAYGVVLTLMSAVRRSEQGGAVAVLASALVEIVASVLLAPVMMLYHSRFVLMILSGRKVSWNTADRSDRCMTWREAVAAVWWAPAIGLALTAFTYFVSAPMLLWLSPVLVGLLLAIPFTWLTSRPDVGRWTRKRKLLLVPEETQPPEVLVKRDSIRKSMSGTCDEFTTLLHDPQLLSMHSRILQATGMERPLSSTDRVRILRRMSRHEPLTRQERLCVQSDAAFLREIHFAVRTGTPLESLIRQPAL